MPLNYKIINMSVLDGIDELEDNSLNCIITSPPYWGLRDYGEDKNTKIWDGIEDCEHEFDSTKRYHPSRGKRNGKGTYTDPKYEAKGSSSSSFISQFCIYCNAWKGQLGLEPTFELFIAHLVQIFDKLRAKLRKDGTLWVNLGDTYAGGNGIGTPKNLNKKDLKDIWNIDESSFDRKNYEEVYPTRNPQAKIVNVKDKSQIGIPERFKIAMIDNGWICRNTIIWHKPSVMPSSVKDRYTNDYEYFFFFSKNKRYYFKQQFEPLSKASTKDLKEDVKEENINYWIKKRNLPPQDKFVSMLREWILHDDSSISLVKSIEELATLTEIPLSTVHHWFRKDEGGFSFPSIEDWEKVEAIYKTDSIGYDFSFLTEYTEELDEIKNTTPDSRNKRTTWRINTATFSEAHFAVYPRTLIESPIDACVPKKICLECDKPMDIEDCGCNAGYRKGVVLDPFCGSGTTIIEALMQEKDAIGIEINPQYVEIAKKRIDKEIPTLSPLDDWA